MRGYWDDPTQTTAALTEDGWFRQQRSLGRLDGDGNLDLAGRATEAYIRGGYNIHPLEIENALKRAPRGTQRRGSGCAGAGDRRDRRGVRGAGRGRRAHPQPTCRPGVPASWLTTRRLIASSSSTICH